MNNQEPAVVVKDLYKTFELPHDQHNGIKQLLVNLGKRKKGVEIQKVLSGVSFEIKKGEFFGIVGRNGSGKSTLLKLLAGIYAPDKGLVQVNGSLTPFIELGVGFNPELTGRENVFLNGALLGFSRKEMEAMYDDIVNFAELKKFMDQKLKNYSSGMQVRLAFSIAIRAKTDVLILDEVLAVGDEAFQRKCDEYFRLIKNDPTKTVILVTHSMDAVRKFCDKAMLLEAGKVKVIGKPEDIANTYTLDNFEEISSPKKESPYPEGLSEKISMIKVTSVSNNILTSADDLVVDIQFEAVDDTPLVVHLGITDEIRNTVILNNGTRTASKGKNKLRYKLPLDIYNDCNLRIYAVIDEFHTKKRIAFTNEENSCRRLIRNKSGNYGLLNINTKVHGAWVGAEDFIYNRNEEIHG